MVRLSTIYFSTYFEEEGIKGRTCDICDAKRDVHLSNVKFTGKGRISNAFDTPKNSRLRAKKIRGVGSSSSSSSSPSPSPSPSPSSLMVGTSGYVVSAVLVLIVGALLAILATVSHHLHHRRLEPLHESNSASILHHHRHLHHHHQRHHQHHHQQQRQQRQQQQQQEQEQEQEQEQQQRQRQHHRRHQKDREESPPALHQQHSFLQDHHRHPGTQLIAGIGDKLSRYKSNLSKLWPFS
ncbi:hormone receptor 4-like [Vespula maculifrons]|uniref:Hormone receptor 4-like n=1 Tax=Vespula maculifrons TaxID=7453 RepID=A0ABD2BWG8_VESMC